MLAVFESYTELRSDTVGTADEDGIPEACLLEIEGTSETTNVTIGTWSAGSLDYGLDGLNESVTGVNGNSSRSVGKTGRSRRISLGGSSESASISVCVFIGYGQTHR